MKSNNLKYRIRELVYYKEDYLIIDYLYEEIFDDLDLVENTIRGLKEMDKKMNLYYLKFVYIIEVVSYEKKI